MMRYVDEESDICLHDELNKEGFYDMEEGKI
jgi:hypothetical protein